MVSEENEYKIAAELIKNSPNFYILTGAGISTESGIPDFRSPGTGLWERVDPTKTATAEVLRSDPKYFYEINFDRFSNLINYEPNEAHYVLAKMEELGYLKGVITQNIDGLHVRAGSKTIWEVHGHTRTCSCQECREQYSFEEARKQMKSNIIPPLCLKCNGVLRPDVVLFGDPMSSDFFEAEKVLASGCDLLMAVGSSLVVYPVAALPRYADKLIIINLQETDYDNRAEIVIKEKCSKALTGILQYL